MKQRRSFFLFVCLLFLAIVPISAEGAVYQGKNIDGITFKGEIVLLLEPVPVSVVFSGINATVYWQEGGNDSFSLKSETIQDPSFIELVGGPVEWLGALLEIHI
jgi:hypothetical protein